MICTGAVAQSWVKVGASGRNMSLHLDAASVRNVGGGIRASVSVTNYLTATGEEESLLAGTLHDCVMDTKRDQFVRMAHQHWGTGQIVDLSGKEKDWRAVKRGSMGAALQSAVCNEQINTPQ